jgi:hypothetical protein
MWWPFTLNWKYYTAHGKVYLTQLYVIKIVSDLRHVSGFLQVLLFRTFTLNWKYYTAITNVMTCHSELKVLHSNNLRIEILRFLYEKKLINHWWCLTSLSTIFQLCHGGQFYWCTKQKYLEKTTDMSQVTDNLYHRSSH